MNKYIEEVVTDEGLGIKYFEGDLCDNDVDFILHQVNCQGVMRAGIAKQISMKWPTVYKEYHDFCKKYTDSSSLLGKIVISDISFYHQTYPNAIVNLFAQNFYGRDKRYTDYEALTECLEKFKEYIIKLYNENSSVIDEIKPLKIGIPYKMSCGLAGGDWNIVYNIICSVFADIKDLVEIHIYYYPFTGEPLKIIRYVK